MTIKATFPNSPTMMFGDSYKRWWTQLAEYCRDFKLPQPSIQVSAEKWISYGGLKWCSEHDFQRELDAEGQKRTIDKFHWRRPTLIERQILRKHVRGWANTQPSQREE
jgi:hypothetical protein